jgi:hypothetical protein
VRARGGTGAALGGTLRPAKEEERGSEWGSRLDDDKRKEGGGVWSEGVHMEGGGLAANRGGRRSGRCGVVARAGRKQGRDTRGPAREEGRTGRSHEE